MAPREKASSVSKKGEAAEAVTVPDGCLYLASWNSCIFGRIRDHKPKWHPIRHIAEQHIGNSTYG